MKFIFTVLLGLFVAFLIDYFLRRRKRPLSKAGEPAEIVETQIAENETASSGSGEARGGTAKKVGKFVLLYFAIVVSSSILVAALGGLTKVYASQAYTIARFAAPVFVYVIFLTYLAKKYSLAYSAKLLAYVYIILVFLRLIYHISRGTQLSYSVLDSVLPYLFLIFVSGVVFLAKRPKTEKDTAYLP